VTCARTEWAEPRTTSTLRGLSELEPPSSEALHVCIWAAFVVPPSASQKLVLPAPPLDSTN